jgi:hypothetical protein
MKMRRANFPNKEVMEEATEKHRIYPERSLGAIFEDEVEAELRSGRRLDGRRVFGTIEGILELPRPVPVCSLGRLS